MENNNNLLRGSSSFNITGINKKFYEIDEKKSKSIKNVRTINKFHLYNIKQKIEFIKNILKKPTLNQPYDGFAIQVNKYTIESLLQKSNEKENMTIFEKNKLCKNNYPLIKFLSNRKSKNNTNKLLIDILRTENGKLTKEQENTIKYEKYKSNSFLKDIIKNKNIINLKHLKNKLLIQKQSEDKNNIRRIINNNYTIFKNTEKKNKIYLTQRNKKSKYPIKNVKSSLKIKNNRPETQRIYTYLGFGETVKLDNHNAIKKNNEILFNRFIRKKYIAYKNDDSEFLDNKIINEASKLKYHNKIMPLNTNILTI